MFRKSEYLFGITIDSIISLESKFRVFLQTSKSMDPRTLPCLILEGLELYERVGIFPKF